VASNILCRRCGVVGHDEGWRIAWCMAKDLDDRLALEQSIWNEWATSQVEGEFARQPPLDRWFSGRLMKKMRRHCPELTDVAGKRVLDIGATLR
jgi:hypothetical protein